MAVVPVDGDKAFGFGGFCNHFVPVNAIGRVIGQLIAQDHAILTKNHARVLIDKFCFYFFEIGMVRKTLRSGLIFSRVWCDCTLLKNVVFII